MSGRKRVIQINGPFHLLEDDHYGFSIETLWSENLLIDADVIFVDSSDIESHSAPYDDLIERFTERVRVRRNHLLSHLKAGRDIVVFVNGPFSLFVLKEITGRDVPISKYVEVSKEEIIPGIRDVVNEPATGINIEFCEEIKTSQDWLEVDNTKTKIFAYKYLINRKGVDVPLLKVKGRSEIVGGVKFIENGRVFYLPTINGKAFIGNLESQANIATQILNFVSVHTFRQYYDNRLTLPTWLNDYKLLDEKVNDKSIEDIDAKIENLIQSKENYLDRRRQLNTFKSILVSSGFNLEESVKSIFTYIGFELLDLEESNRVDIVIKNGDRYIVCEVKGVGGSAKESFATQLEKWSSEFYENLGVIPKSLLIVGTYNKLPLAERPDTHFPNQMVKYVKMKSQCCLTTLSLLKILEKFEQDGIGADEVFDLLYDTVGVLKI